MNEYKTYSTVSESFFKEKLKKEKEKEKTDRCKFAVDTGKLALPHRPCKGNLIICHHEENFLERSFVKQCSPVWCKYFTRK